MDERAEPGKIGSRPVHRGRIVDLSIDTVRFPDGSTGELEMIRHSGAAAVLPVFEAEEGADPDVLLVKQYRYASGGYLYEVPAGRPDRPGEDWEDCARRELQEETGYTADVVTRMTSILTTPGFTDERIHLFLARGLRQGAASLDRDEFLDVVRLPFSSAVRMVQEERITDAKTICTLLFAGRFLLGR